MLIIVETDVVRCKGVEIVNVLVEYQFRSVQGLISAGQLGLHGFDVILIDMGIVDDVRKEARTEAGRPGNEVDENGILGHVEGYS